MDFHEVEVSKEREKGEGRRSKDISCRLKDISQLAFQAVFCEEKMRMKVKNNWAYCIRKKF